MVSFTAAGRLGNFFFECATSLAYSLRHNLDFSVPHFTSNKKWSPIYLENLQNPNYNHNLEQIHLWENQHTYEELPFEESWRDKNIIIEGYRQSWKYFDEYRNEILYLFGLRYEMKKGVISVHVRRGDYLTLTDKHPYYGEDWYKEVMFSKFLGYKYKFFSDDINWCKENFGYLQDVEFSTNTNELDDLIEASCCEHQINSSSTFSWWISYLNRNPNKKCYFPKLWFVEGYHLDTKDILHPDFIKVDL